MSHKWTVLRNFDQALRYSGILGFWPAPAPGYIPHAQSIMCDIESALYRANGGSYPITVHFRRNPDAPRFPYFGTFLVKRPDGQVIELKARDILK